MHFNHLPTKQFAFGGRHLAGFEILGFLRRQTVDHKTTFEVLALDRRHVLAHDAPFVLRHVPPTQKTLLVRQERPELRPLFGRHLFPHQNLGLLVQARAKDEKLH